MNTMKAAIYTGIEQIGIQEVEKKSPEPGYVMLDTKCTGICGSDLHSYFGHWGQSDSLAAGHEHAVSLLNLGKALRHSNRAIRSPLNASHTVAIAFTVGKATTTTVWNGNGFHKIHTAVFRSIPPPMLQDFSRLPDSMTFEEGALVEPLAVSYRAIGQARATYQDTVAIIGGGTIGQFALAAAVAAGVKETLITVKYDHQAELAKKLGADHVVNIGETDPNEYVKDITGGRGMDAVIETVGGGHNFDAAMDMVRSCGYVVLVAGYYEPLKVNLGRIVGVGGDCHRLELLRLHRHGHRF